MKRRQVLLGLGALAVGGAIAQRPRDHGAPYNDYFAALNAELKANGPMRPSLVVDLDALDHNIDTVVASVAKVPGRHLRVVEKSLPSPKLLAYIGQRAKTARLMSFHQPFLNHDAARFPAADILLGKPLPVRSAALFYQQHQGAFDPARQLQWLVDTPARVAEYLVLAQGLGTVLNLNIELDVGLHRGGVADLATLSAMLQQIEAHPAQLRFAGFMGYDPFVALLPRVLGSPEELLAQVMQRYQAAVDHTRRLHGGLWREDLTLNTAGSPTYQLHEAETLSNDLSVGTGLLKPSHFDLVTLAKHRPAAYIATPVLKATGAVSIPGLGEKSRLFSWWDVNQRSTYFIYGGHWMADFESPAGLQLNPTYGRSSNQEMVNASPAVGLAVNDHLFLRPQQTEAVLLQFGDLIAVRGGKIVDYWPVFV